LNIIHIIRAQKALSRIGGSPTFPCVFRTMSLCVFFVWPSLVWAEHWAFEPSRKSEPPVVRSLARVGERSGNPRPHQAIRAAVPDETAVPELADIAAEPQAVRDTYGAEPAGVSFANNCLFAWRLSESGVRFVQLYEKGWDSHGEIAKQHTERCRAVDCPIAALIADLKQRGLLDETLVIWGGEFDRTPMAQGSGSGYGRDHHPHCFTVWMAGDGIRRASSTVRPMTLAIFQSGTRCTSTISTPPSCTALAWTMNGLPTGIRAATSA